MERNDCLHSINACVIIPTYNNAKTLRKLIDGVLVYTPRIIIVNDGSTDETPAIIQQYPNLCIENHSVNQGKGKAIRTGFAKALEKGFDYALTIDSDGQHYPDDIPHFVKEIEENGEALIIGSRNMTQEGIPKGSSFGNKFSNFWFRVETGIDLTDTQSGFRLYPIKKLQNIRFFTTKYEFEIEIIVRAAWRGIPVKNIPIKVLYDKTERVSHFRPYKDFARITVVNTILVTIAFLYIKPRDYFRKYKKKGFKRFFLEDFLHSDDSPSKKSFSVALGVFIGLSPFWGFQTALAIFLAIFFKLNKLISFAFSNVSLPPLIPFIVYGGCKTGNFLIGKGDLNLQWDDFESYKDMAGQNIKEYILGSFTLAFIGSLLAGIISYLFLNVRKNKVSSF